MTVHNDYTNAVQHIIQHYNTLIELYLSFLINIGYNVGCDRLVRSPLCCSMKIV